MKNATRSHLSSSRGRSLRSSYGYSSYQQPAAATSHTNATPASGHLSLSTPVAATRLPLQDSPHELKKRIQQHFESTHADRYFNTLQDFFTGSLSKPEFDDEIRSFLSEDERKLHNIFMLTVLRSGYTSLSTSSTRRRVPQAVPYVPRLGCGSDDIGQQKVWQRIYSHVIYKASCMGITEIDTATVSAIMLALEHHLKSIISAGGPSKRLKRRLPVPSILRYLHEEENQEILDHNRPGVIDSSDLRLAMPYNSNIGRLGSRNFLFIEDINPQPIFLSDQQPPIQEKKEEKNNEEKHI
eukprot:TRINITY_DN4473_c0_g1_i1.p1 TRINITY_DN4473_c0_g1~~TRINITY_DN4473_c0_g1_i1.p1  ORF type:complete len:297 (+),score=49.17 TRINITY_DN4473_c0_g1_i1:24-914(+)